MIARRPQYTKTLLRELLTIGATPDGELDRTALRFLFRTGGHGIAGDEALRGDALSMKVADTAPLNSEQRTAVESLLCNPLTVVTGPPGTGKSQVVSTVIANAHLYGQSILFASRNHKAIDAVYERCRSEDGRPLLVRCNSRDDPSLRVTFATIIGQLLGGSADVGAAEKAGVLLEDLHRCLEKRAEKLDQAEVRW